ncbi:MAG: hypothetical protein P9M07_02650 [Candidatus Aceula meridiana]|nr:hypothetical protein [Candidatus Aceula meridiana]
MDKKSKESILFLICILLAAFIPYFFDMDWDIRRLLIMGLVFGICGIAIHRENPLLIRIL